MAESLASNELKISCSSLIDVLSRNLRGWTEENHDKLLSGQPVFQPRFELNTAQIQVYSVNAISVYSVKWYHKPENHSEMCVIIPGRKNLIIASGLVSYCTNRSELKNKPA